VLDQEAQAGRGLSHAEIVCCIAAEGSVDDVPRETSPIVLLA
jgi:hypothetical protein